MTKTIFALLLVVPFAAGCSKTTSDTSAASSPGGSVASAAKGQKFTFGQAYKVGDKSTYNMKMDQSAGNMNMSMTVMQEITKVYDNGDADMKETSSDIVMNAGGKETKVPSPQPVTMRVDKNGAPQGGANDGMGAGYGAVLSKINGGLTVGQTVPYDYDNPAKPGSHDKGNITYVSADGPSKFHVVSDTTDPKNGNSHIVGDMSFDTVSKKPLLMDLTITSAGTTPNTTHFVMTLKGA